MGENRTHERLSRTAEDWLIYLANPGDPIAQGRPPRTKLNLNDLDRLFGAAALHGVLPATLRNLENNPDVLPTNGEPAVARARAMIEGVVAFGLLLSHHAGRVMNAFESAGLDATVVKGPTFAKRLYPEAWLRTFTDIDVLVSPDHRAKTGEAMRDLGFELFEIDERAGKDYFEDKWILTSNKDVNVEVHGDLVHSPKLRKLMTVGYKQVVAAGDGDPESPAALFLVATAHGAIGHQFERFQQVVDVAQAAAGAAGPIDVTQLRSVAGQSGTTWAIAASLKLVNRVFPSPAIRNLASAFPAPLSFAPSLFLSPKSLVRTHDPNRTMNAWRRKIVRQLVRFGSTTDRAHG